MAGSAHGHRVLGIIPARAGSKRVPGKNKRVLHGKPLFRWALEAAMKSARLDRLVVSSDDPDILEDVRTLDASIPLARPPELAGDTSPAVDYVLHALKAVEARESGRFDVVAIIQPTSPLVLKEDIDATIDLLISSTADTAVSVQRIDQVIHPFKLKQMQGDRVVPYLENEEGRMAAHEIPDIFVRNGAVYASRREVFEAGRVIGDDCRGYVMPRERSVDINDEIDFRFAEFLLDACAN